MRRSTAHYSIYLTLHTTDTAQTAGLSEEKQSQEAPASYHLHPSRTNPCITTVACSTPFLSTPSSNPILVSFWCLPLISFMFIMSWHATFTTPTLLDSISCRFRHGAQLLYHCRGSLYLVACSLQLPNCNLSHATVPLLGDKSIHDSHISTRLVLPPSSPAIASTDTTHKGLFSFFHRLTLNRPPLQYGV